MTAAPATEGLGNVLVAYDGSAAAQRALRHAAELVGRDGTVTAVNVIPVQSVSARLETVREEERTRQRTLLHEARSILGALGVHCRSVEAAGDPVAEILATAAKHSSGVIVVGRDAGNRHLHASVSGKLVRRARCDVLVVH